MLGRSWTWEVMQGRSWFWAAGEALVVLPGLALVSYAATEEDVLYKAVALATSLLLFVLALLSWRPLGCIVAGWILVVLGGFLFIQVVTDVRKSGESSPARYLAGVAAPPLGGVLLLVAGYSARSRNSPLP